MSVHYKFKSALDYDTVTFDGLHISVGDLKSAISQQKRIGKTSDFDLQITNAQTKEVYVDDNTLIPKNTSLLVARVPLAQQPKKQWEANSNQGSLHKDVAPNKGLADLSRMEGSEQDKINAMISQSTFDYDPSNYQKIRGQNQRGVVPNNYVCYKCQKRGHWIKDCPTANSSDPVEIRRSTGIPRSFMVPVEGPKAPGAMMTPSGTFAVPVVDREAYLASESGPENPGAGASAAAAAVPDELVCSLCRDLLTDAVMIPCCGNSFCDECIRGALLESEDHECPDCREKEISPATLIPNRFLRNSVSSFRNQTGYSRRAPHRPAAPPALPPPQTIEPPPGSQQGPPPNGPMHAPPPAIEGRAGPVGEESDGSADDHITVTLPGASRVPPPRDRDRDRHPNPRYGPPPALKPPGIDTPPNIHGHLPRLDEQRANTPTVDERRDPTAQGYNRGPPPFLPNVPPPSRHRYNSTFGRSVGPGGAPPFNERFPPEPYQPPPPGIKDSPTNGHGEDPLEAFNRMIREKEMRAKRREERWRAPSGSRSPRSPQRPPRSPQRLPRSPQRLPRSPPRLPRSPQRLPRSPQRLPRSPQRLPRSPQRPPRSPRSQRSQRSPRSPRSLPRSPRSPRSPRPRPRSRGSSRIRFSRSRSLSRGRLRRSPWSPRRRRSRERSISLTRSPSPRRRPRSPVRYRSPLRSPPRSPLRSPLRSPPRSPPRSPIRSPMRSPMRSPLRSPHRLGMRSPPPQRSMSPHRFAGVYDELLSPPRRSVEPPFGARYGPRNNLPPPGYHPPMGLKQIPPLGSMAIPPDQPPGYRGRYDVPPFEEIPPGVEPPVPGFEPSPFEKPPFGPPGAPLDRDRLPPPNYRDPYRPPPYGDGPAGYRDMPIPPLIPNEIPVHVGEQPPRFRDNFRPPSYRDQGPVPFRDGQPYREPGPPGNYRDPNFRGGPPQFRDSFRNVPYRDGGFRENPPGFRDPGAPFRPPSADPREPIPPNYHDPNFRDNFRDESGVPRDGRPGYRSSVRSRGVPRRNANMEHDRHRERDGRDRERYNENRDPSDRTERPRDADRRPGYDKNRDGREGRDDRPRDYERSRDYDKDRDHDKTPDRKVRSSPKRREIREKKRSESRGRSRDRDNRRDKKEERIRDKSSERNKDHKEKEKDKKIKDRKKKKREKEKDIEKKKKREKKDKKEKDNVKKEDEEDVEKEDKHKEQNLDNDNVETEKQVVVKTENDTEEVHVKTENVETSKVLSNDKANDDLYGEEATGAVDKEIIENYVKIEEKEAPSDVNNVDTTVKEEPFDGIELQATAEELDLKAEIESGNQPNKEMLAPLPELSKWEVDDENADKVKEPGEITDHEDEEDEGKVTSDVIKRAENAIFAKAINSLRPIEIKKISSDRLKLYGDDAPKTSMNNIQITVPVVDSEARSIEINERKRRSSKTPPPRLSVKERLGGKVEDIRRSRDTRVVHSTVELVKSRSKTPKSDQHYRRVTVERERGRKEVNRPESVKSDRRFVSEGGEKHRDRSPNYKKYSEKHKEVKNLNNNEKSDSRDQGTSATEENKNLNVDRERKKSTLDEAHFEPDYDENVESDNNENKEENVKKRERSSSLGSATKKPKLEPETIKLDVANVKRKVESDTDSSSGSDDSSSSSSSDARKRKKKKKRSKKKKKRAASDSDSDSDSSSDDHKKKKKKRKHKKKSSKKKKKSKHK